MARGGLGKRGNPNAYWGIAPQHYPFVLAITPLNRRRELGFQIKQRVNGDVANHVGAPMPGMVVTIAVKAGQKVKKGDPLLSIEAMKMETMLTAERDATVHALHVRSGESINAKDLLLELN
jgi:pyruvate carboxylase